MKRVALAALGVVLVVIVLLDIENPMLLIFPLWIFTYLLKEKLEGIIGRLPGSTGFVIAGITYGMLIEIFAILNSLDQPVSERVLLDGNPAKDLMLGVFYYAFVIISWYFLLKKVAYSKREVFFITGIYGVVVEETGQVILRALAQPLMGTLYAVIVMIVYGLFPILAMMVAGKRFPVDRKKSSVGTYVLAVVVLFVQYALYGNTVYPMLKVVL